MRSQRATRSSSHGYGLGTAQHGGFAEYARVPAAWALPLPGGLDAREAMVLGTAGWTAAASIVALQRHGLRPGDGPVLVTGASGGVGMCATAMLAHVGCEVTACTGKAAEHGRLRDLGAAEVVGRDAIAPTGKPLARQRWAAVVDCVGGEVLSGLLPAVRYGGAVAASGMAGGFALKTTVLPFILRGIALLGINSVDTPMDVRQAVWGRMASDLRPVALDARRAGRRPGARRGRAQRDRPRWRDRPLRGAAARLNATFFSHARARRSGSSRRSGRARDRRESARSAE